MTPTDLLAELRRRRVVLRVNGDGLLARAPRGALTAELRTALAAQKDALLDLLCGEGAPEGYLERLRAVYACLSEPQHERLLNDAAGGDPVAQLVLRLVRPRRNPVAPGKVVA